MISVNLKA